MGRSAYPSMMASRSSGAWRDPREVTALSVDPERALKIGSMNGRQARETGLWLKVQAIETRELGAHCWSSHVSSAILT